MKYYYRCLDCKKKFHWYVIGNPNNVHCSKCGSKNTVKLISKPHLIFKGTGWGKDKK